MAQNTLLAFQLSLRYCRQHEGAILADKLATNLTDKQFNKFWQNVHKQSNAKVAAKVNTVAGCVGDYEISDMCKTHFDSLYHSVDDDGSKQTFLQRMSELNKQHGRYCLLYTSPSPRDRTRSRMPSSA